MSLIIDNYPLTSNMKYFSIPLGCLFALVACNNPQPKQATQEPEPWENFSYPETKKENI